MVTREAHQGLETAKRTWATSPSDYGRVGPSDEVAAIVEVSVGGVAYVVLGRIVLHVGPKKQLRRLY